MKDFLYRSVEIESPAEFFDADGNAVPIRASRTRNSAGFGMISLTVGTQTIQFSSDVNGEDGGYEQLAREAMRLLETVCDNPCTLPRSGEPLK